MKVPFSTSKPSTPAPEGAHPARLVRIVDLGTQVSHFQDKEIIARKLSLAWELYTDPKMEDGRPFMVSERYTMSLNEKATLHKMLAGWLGKEFQDAAKAGCFDFSKLLGRPCLVTVNHGTSKTGSTFAKIGGVTVLPKALASVMEPQVNPSLLFDLSAFDQAIYDSLPPWQREEIAKSPEYAAATGKSTQIDDSVPF